MTEQRARPDSSASPPDGIESGAIEPVILQPDLDQTSGSSLRPDPAYEPSGEAYDDDVVGAIAGAGRLPERAPRDLDEQVELWPEVIAPAMRAMPGLARLGASAWLHGAEWGLSSSSRLAGRLAAATTDPRQAKALLRDASEGAHIVGDAARAFSSGASIPAVLSQLGNSLSAIGEHTPGQDANGESALGPGAAHPREQKILRQRGKELLDRSRDVWRIDAIHPAYTRILEELAPDEARVLVLLLTGGPQPSVDVRTGGAIGMVSSNLVKSGLTMIGPRAGVRHQDEIPAYLNNLFRLGLIWLSREQVDDPMEYQVLEAQPEVVAWMKSVRAHKVVRRSVHLTPFGEQFCRAVFVDAVDAPGDLPEHTDPED